MKKLIASIAMVAMLSVTTGCGSDMIINGKNETTYGLINKDEVRNPKVEYQLVVGNVIWGILLFETVVAPIYFFCFSIYEPVGLKAPN
jgi:hypothetical protein